MASAVRPLEGELALKPQAAAMQARLEAKAGVSVEAVFAPRGQTPVSLIYKVAGKTFAILSARDDQFVIVKSDPHLAEVLREQYRGIGHRTHLDPRHWICVTLDADVPAEEAARLADASYDLVAAGLTRKQKAALAAL